MKRNPFITHLVAFGYVGPLLNWLLKRGDNLSITDLLTTDGLKLLGELRFRSLAPLIYQEIRKQGLDREMPPPLLEGLRNNYALSMAQTLRQEQDVVVVLRELSAGGVAPILLKGADARLRLYGNPIVRPMADLDLLISPDELPRAQGILAGLDYRQTADFRPGFGQRFMGQIHLHSANGRLMVDLHWYLEAVANFYRLPYQRLAQMAVSWEYEGMQVRLLCPEHALIHLCLHNYDELWNALQIIDLGLAVTRLPIDWEVFLQEAACFRCQAPIFLMLNGLNQNFPQAVPETVLSSLNQYQPPFWEKLALRPILGRVFSPLARLYHQRRLSDWAAYLRAIIWPDPDYLVAIWGKPDRAAYLRQAIRNLLRWVDGIDDS